MGFDTFREAVHLFATGRLARAADALDQVADDGSLYAEAAAWLRAVDAKEAPRRPYEDARAFRDYRDGVPSSALRDAGTAALTEIAREVDPTAVLDIGPGDGRVLADALSAAQVKPRSVTLVEPTPDLLSAATEAVRKFAVPITFAGTLQGFVERSPPIGQWDLVHASLSLQNLAPQERAIALPWLQPRTRTLALVEFDCHRPAGDPLDDEYVRWMHDRYVDGVAAHSGTALGADREANAKRGFLMPMLFGSFLGGTSRPNHEQTAEQWTAELRAAGFERVDVRMRHEHWWSDAVLLTAS